jgi:hypothetical protein
MASAKATIDLHVPVDDVWELIGGFGSLPDWLPFIQKSTLTDGGRVRHLETLDGQSIVSVSRDTTSSGDRTPIRSCSLPFL